MLGIEYQAEIEQDASLNGQSLKTYQPWRYIDIQGDGNCLFRCFSKILTGSEKHHLKLRGEICRYMVTQGRNTIGWYFQQVQSTTPAKYLRASGMLMEMIWGGDVELMALSALLKTEIFVANRFYLSEDTLIQEIRWSRIRACNDTYSTSCIYISNFKQHFEPVAKMINNTTLTYFPPNQCDQVVYSVE